MNNQQENMQIELVMTHCEGLYRHLHERTEENYETLTQNNGYVYHDF